MVSRAAGPGRVRCHGLETKRIFNDPALKRDSDAATIAGFAANPLAFGHNDLQPVAEQLCPEMVQVLQWLGSMGLHGRMTGSGSAVFAPLPPAGTQAGTSQEVPAVRPEGWIVRECGNMEVHPLAGWAPSDD